MMLAKEGGKKLPSALILEVPGVPEDHESQGPRKHQGKRLMGVNRHLPQGKRLSWFSQPTGLTDSKKTGVHMTKATERKIDYVDKEMP